MTTETLLHPPGSPVRSPLQNPLFINLILLGGTPQEKFAAAQAAGFDQVELWRQDVEAFNGSPAEIKTALQDASLGLTDYQVLLDFDGAPPEIRESKREEALRMLDTAVKVGATTLLSPASTRADCVAERVVEDMRWLADEAAARNLRVAYEGMAWSKINFTLASAWACVQQVGAPNLGLVVDAFHMFARDRDASDLDGIPMDRIYLVQLSDLLEEIDLPNIIEIARHRRLLPGQGRFPIATILDRLKASGYAGPIGLEVFNDNMKARDPYEVARESMAALRSVWLDR